jgi:Holliday junction resolvasome RuvABC endonuclease subunit
MNILGLDVSSKKSGYALFQNQNLIEYGLWELSKEEESDWRKRIIYMAKCVADYCDLHYIDVVYIEDVPPIIQNSQTIKVLSALQGMLLAVFSLRDIEVEFIPVKTWKSKIGINLTASKENNVCKKHFKEYYDKESRKYLERLKNATKAYEKKLSVDYVNQMFGLDLVYKSASSKNNQDDIADAICIGASQIFNQPHHVYNFEEIMSEICDSITK